MKPRDWHNLSSERQIEVGNSLFNTLRGRYLVGQALSVAIKSLREVPMPFREESNIQDMEILRETVFTLPCPQDLGLAYTGGKKAAVK